MYVIDITRDNTFTDMLCGNNSMDAKNKTFVSFTKRHTIFLIVN